MVFCGHGIWRHADSYQPDRGPPKAWMIGILRNRAIDHLRKACREIPSEEATAGLADQPMDEAGP